MSQEQVRTNEPKIWKNSKNNEAQPKLSGCYKRTVFSNFSSVTKPN